jgi:transposase InsO family protein
MDFISGLPTTQKGHDSIWVIVDRLTKTAHFLPVKADYRPPQYAEKYIAEIVRLHDIPKTIVSDRGSQFTAHFWEHLHKGLGTSLICSTSYHPQTDSQTERVNAVLEDMLRACVLSSKGSWESWLPLAEFAYNNSYQESIKMAPFEALYGRKCRTPLNWIEPGERRYYDIDFVEEAEKKVHIIQQNIKAA